MRKFIAAIFILILVIPLLTASLITSAVRSWIFNRDFYNQLFNSERIEFVLENSNLLTPLIEQSGGNEEFAIAANAAFKIVFDSEYLESQLDGFVNQIFDFYQGSSPELNLQIDLKPIKDAIEEEKKTEFIDAFVNNLPNCNSGKHAEFTPFGYMRCLSISVQSDPLKRELSEEMLPRLLPLIPDSIQATSIDLSPILKWTSMLGLVSIQQAFNIGLIILLAISVFLWLVVVCIADKRFRVRLRWLGGALILPAILTIASGFLVLSNIAQNWSRAGVQQFSATPLGADLVTSMMDAAQTALSRIGLAFLIVGVIAIGLASILIALGILIRPKS